MYEVFEKLCTEHGVRHYTVCKATGISTATLSDWKKGKYTPKTDKLQKIADYFGVPLEYLQTGVMPPLPSVTGDKYRFSNYTAEMAQEIYADPDLRSLFDAARGSSPSDLQLAAEMLRRLKGKS